MQQEQDYFLEMEEQKVPTGINVLTILTFIGSGFGILFSLMMPWFVKLMLGMLDKASSLDSKMSPKEIQKMEEGKQQFVLMQQNMTAMIAVGVIGCVLCIVAAVMMRKRKKDGYFLYVFAEVLPVIVTFITMRSVVTKDAWAIISNLFIPVLFIILYTFQKKHLTK